MCNNVRNSNLVESLPKVRRQPVEFPSCTKACDTRLATFASPSDVRKRCQPCQTPKSRGRCVASLYGVSGGARGAQRSCFRSGCHAAALKIDSGHAGERRSKPMTSSVTQAAVKPRPPVLPLLLSVSFFVCVCACALRTCGKQARTHQSAFSATR